MGKKFLPFDRDDFGDTDAEELDYEEADFSEYDNSEEIYCDIHGQDDELRKALQESLQMSKVNSKSPSHCVSAVKSVPIPSQSRITANIKESRRQVPLCSKESEKLMKLYKEHQGTHYYGHNSIFLSVIGHVDSGKSTLMGQLLYLLSNQKIRLEEKEAERQGKKSFEFAWLLDSSTEERQRGITMDISIHSFSTKISECEDQKFHITFIDTPGHRDFLNGMIIGSALSQFSVLVVDASLGAFEAGLKTSYSRNMYIDPDTNRENVEGNTMDHFWILKGLQMNYLLVAINKMDNVNWDPCRVDFIRETILEKFKNIDYKPQVIYFVPVSAYLGINIVTRRLPESPSLLEVLHQMAKDYFSEDKIKVDSASLCLCAPFSSSDFKTDASLALVGQIIKGTSHTITLQTTILSGSLKVGDSLILLPISQECSIKTIELSLVQTNTTTVTSKMAFKGDFATMTLAGLDDTYFQPGQLLLLSTNKKSNKLAQILDQFVRNTSTDIFARLYLLPDRPIILTPGFPALIHIFNMCESICITKLFSSNQQDISTPKSPARFLKEGQDGYITFKCSRSLALIPFTKYLLRHQGTTIGYGFILNK